MSRTICSRNSVSTPNCLYNTDNTSPCINKDDTNNTKSHIINTPKLIQTKIDNNLSKNYKTEQQHFANLVKKYLRESFWN